MLKKISILFIIIGVIGLLLITSIDLFQKNKNKRIVNELQMREYDEKNYYVGYIEICYLKIPLVYGSSDKEIDQNIVGIDNHSTIEHLILAGHAIKSVFLCLYDIRLNEEIIVVYQKTKNKYYIDNKKIVKNTDTSIFYNDGLTLITCLDDKRRLIVHAKNG